MFIISEQFASAIKSNLEAQYAITAALNDRIVDRFEELTRLNIDAIKATMTESTATAKELVAAKNPQEFFLSCATHMKRDVQNAIFYSSEATRIASSAQSEFNKAAGEKFAEVNRNGAALLTDLTKNVPAGAEHIINIMKSAFVTINAEDRSVKKASDGAGMAEDGQSAAVADSALRSKKRPTHISGSSSH